MYAIIAARLSKENEKKIVEQLLQGTLTAFKHLL